MAICLVQNRQGQGGVGGGAGNLGQTSQVASGSAARGYGVPVVSIYTGMTATLQFQLTEDIGGTNPSDLTSVSTIKFVAKPCMGSTQEIINKTCTKVLDSQSNPTGQIQLALGPDQVNCHQGIHYAQVLCYNASQQLIKDFKCYLQIKKGMTGYRPDGVYPVTIGDVRMAVMDTSQQMNELIDDLQFSDIMIIDCIMRAVNEWNQTPPQLAQRFDATNFPFRQALIKGAASYLMKMVSYRYARNRMQHSNAGLTLDDSDKAPTYLQYAAAERQQWVTFIMAKKTQLNMQECFLVVKQPWFQNNYQDIWTR